MLSRNWFPERSREAPLLTLMRLESDKRLTWSTTLAVCWVIALPSFASRYITGKYRVDDREFLPTVSNHSYLVIDGLHPLVNTGHPVVNSSHLFVNASHPFIDTNHPVVNANHSIVDTRHRIFDPSHSIVDTSHRSSNFPHLLVDSMRCLQILSHGSPRLIVCQLV